MRERGERQRERERGWRGRREREGEGGRMLSRTVSVDLNGVD